MHKSPAFQFYAADYLADENIAMMTNSEEGIYIHLLAYCWREGTIPSSEESLSRLCKNAPLEEIRRVKKCFEQCSNSVERMFHKRLDAERVKQESYRTEKSLAGKASGKARKKKKLQDEQVFDSVRTKDEQKRTLLSSSSSLSSSSFASSTSTTEPTTNSKENTRPLPAPPALVPVELWLEFVEMRKKIRKPLTERAVHLIHGRLQKFKNEGQDPVECMEQSIRNCWQDIFPVREERNGATKTDIRGQRTVSAITRVLGGSGEVVGPIRPALPTSH